MLDIKLDNESLFKKLKKALMEIIERKIANGDIKLPPEATLCKQLGVSRTVLRDVLSHLEALGYILRKRSKGTIINKYVVNIGARIDIDCEIEDLISEKNDSFEYCDIEIQEIAADEESAAKLNVSMGDKLMMIKKKYRVKGEDVAFDIDIFPKKLIAEEYTLEDFRGSVYKFFEEKCKMAVEIMVSHISAQEIDGTLYLHIDEVGNNIDQVPILWSRQYYSSNYFKYFSIIRRKA